MTSRLRKIGRRSPREATEEHDALLVGNVCDGFDAANSWRLRKGTHQ